MYVHTGPENEAREHTVPYSQTQTIYTLATGHTYAKMNGIHIPSNNLVDV